jgi:hypothetical protein
MRGVTGLQPASPPHKGGKGAVCLCSKNSPAKTHTTWIEGPKRTECRLGTPLMPPVYGLETMKSLEYDSTRGL